MAGVWRTTISIRLTQISAATGDPIFGGGTAKGGDIVIQAGSLELVNSAQISSATFGAGNAGRIEITASSVRLDALLTTPTQITANTQQIDGGGNAGDIVIHTDTLDMLNGATILAASFGSGRRVSSTSMPSRSISSAAPSLRPALSARVTGATFRSPPTRCASTDGTLTGGPDFLTGIQAVTTSSDSPAPGGSIQITASSLDLDHMGSIFTTSFGSGPGGNIDVTAGNLTLAKRFDDPGRRRGDRPRRQHLASSRQSMSCSTGHSAVSTSAPGSSGGDISVSAGSEIRLVDSQITAQAGLDGGNITLAAPELIYLLHSTLTGEADTTGSGFGNGGNLTIDPSFSS